jgi:purine-nucleoside phosphorylase
MIAEAARYLQARLQKWPATALVLGSAQAEIANAVDHPVCIEYREIPGWPVPTVEGHAGRLIIGQLSGVPIIVMSGRVHLYEGWTAQQVTFGIRVLGSLGIRNLLLTNAAGGINPAYRVGRLVLITDHINLQGVNPLVGPNDIALGPRFPDMTRAYDEELRTGARHAATSAGIALDEGVYAGLFGPSFETPAEIRYLRAIGADLAGMSTVAETIVARHMGIRVMAISTVTNMAAGMQKELSHHEVLDVGRNSAHELKLLFELLLPTLES